jgi:exopolysaccharide biosynthesis polyprenyl glycosylphosphotransferase
MTTALRPRTFVLFLGDICFLVFALWLSLLLRTREAPSRELFTAHLLPFTLLFVVWLFVFFIAGLYESRSIILERRRISITLLASQVVNIVIASVFFFLFPLFGIAPKTLLAIYLVVSFLLVLLWHVALFPHFAQKPEHAIVVGEGQEIEEHTPALLAAPHAPARIVACVRPSEAAMVGAVKKSVAEYAPRFIIADFNNAAVAASFPEFYTYLMQGIHFIDAMSLYEDVFGRIPLSVIDDRWLARNVSVCSHRLYDVPKRFMDITVAAVLGCLSLVCYPFLIIAIYLYDRGPIFYRQIRTGENNKLINMLKFRSMTGMDQGEEMLKSKHTVTPVGRMIRATRIDEIPQLWSVLTGDMSLIGPRPEFPAMVKEYAQEIPYYNVRHLVRPGLSGWAQLYHDNHPHHGTEVEATREKLSFDLYYVKHRSVALDIAIALKTIKAILTHRGV